jgi:mannose-1-phosphate guanylyltransferase
MRLRPLTEELPKPLVPIGDRSILAHIADSLSRAGVGHAVINTHHLPRAFDSVVPELPIEARVIHEAEILGTAGGLAGARVDLGPTPVLIWNGDIWIEPPIAELLAWTGDGARLLVARRPLGEGVVGLGDDGRVVRLRGERFGDELSGADYVGVAALGDRCLAELPAQGCLIGDWALPELRAGGRIETLTHAGPWTDAGDLAAYLDANQRWLGSRDAWVGDEVRVAAGIEFSKSVIGRGARVTGEGRLERVVVWPGAEARAPLADAVVTRSGRVVRAQGANSSISSAAAPSS